MAPGAKRAERLRLLPDGAPPSCHHIGKRIHERTDLFPESIQHRHFTRVFSTVMPDERFPPFFLTAYPSGQNIVFQMIRHIPVKWSRPAFQHAEHRAVGILVRDRFERCPQIFNKRILQQGSLFINKERDLRLRKSLPDIHPVRLQVACHNGKVPVAQAFLPHHPADLPRDKCNLRTGIGCGDQAYAGSIGLSLGILPAAPSEQPSLQFHKLRRGSMAAFRP